MRQKQGSVLLITAACLLALAFLNQTVLASAQIEVPRGAPLKKPAGASSDTPLPLENTPTPQFDAGNATVLTSTITVTPTVIVTPTITIEPTITPTITLTPALVCLPQINQAFSPIATATPTPRPTETLLYCHNANMSIPDNSQSGVRDDLVVDTERIIYDINVYLDIEHSWIGDLAVYLTHTDTGRNITLLNRPGAPAISGGCNKSNIGAILDDEMSLPAQTLCASADAAIAGIYIPYETLAFFDGEAARGAWNLKVTDLDQYSTGSLDRWCVHLTVGDSPIPETPLPTPVVLPSSALITNISSKAQDLPLDCESRVAVDWAAYFGYRIDEHDFFNHLPKSDNPDAGFVGNVNGTWGKIPPHDYGVHAEPVAALLRDRYGVPAYAHRSMSFERLKTEIAANRPVYVWIVGGGSNYHFEIPVYYTSSDNHRSIVAPYEHTVMVIGYSETNVTILDGGKTYTPSNFQFLASWSALENMALIALPE